MTVQDYAVPHHPKEGSQHGCNHGSLEQHRGRTEALLAADVVTPRQVDERPHREMQLEERCPAVPVVQEGKSLRGHAHTRAWLGEAREGLVAGCESDILPRAYDHIM